MLTKPFGRCVPWLMTWSLALAACFASAAEVPEMPATRTIIPLPRADAHPLSEVEAILTVLSSSAWHLLVAVVVLAVLLALLLEAVADWGLRAQAHGKAIQSALGDSVDLGSLGLTRAVLSLPSDELAAQLAALAGLSAPPGSDGVSIRSLLLERGPQEEGPAVASTALEWEAQQIERQLDRLQAALRESYRRQEMALALALGGMLAGLWIWAIDPSSLAGTLSLLVLAVLIPLAAALLAPMLRELLRNAMRRV